MAVKKKPAVKKTAAKKKPAVKKTTAKRTTAKRTTAKKSTAKKSVAKKSVVKKSAVKKSAKKAVKKSAVKKRAVKKSAVKKRAASASSIVIPAVPSSLGAGRVDVSTTPKPASRSVATPPAQTSKPKEAPKQGASGKVLVAIIVAIILLAVLVITRPDSESDDAAPAPTPAASATVSEEPTVEPTEEPTEEVTSAPVTDIEGAQAVGNWKDSAKSVMTISWKAPTASAGLTGYKVEIRVNRGEWVVKSEVPSDQLSIDFSKTDASGETSFRVSSIYSDGQEAVGNSFGFSGVFE